MAHGQQRYMQARAGGCCSLPLLDGPPGMARQPLFMLICRQTLDAGAALPSSPPTLPRLAKCTIWNLSQMATPMLMSCGLLAASVVYRTAQQEQAAGKRFQSSGTVARHMWKAHVLAAPGSTMQAFQLCT